MTTKKSLEREVASGIKGGDEIQEIGDKNQEDLLMNKKHRIRRDRS